MSFQDYAAMAVVGAALVGLILRARRSLSRPTGCGGCFGCADERKKTRRLIEISPPRDASGS